jgi:hypothetical protein
MSLSHAWLQTIVVAVSLALSSSVSGQESDLPNSAAEVVESADSEEIPISTVWSNRIPGTRDIFELEPDVPAELMKVHRDLRSQRNRGNTLTQQIARKLGNEREMERSVNKKFPALKMFAVLGHGKEALKRAHSVLVEESEPQLAFSSGDNITLVFFTDWGIGPILFRSITSNANTITINYSFDTSDEPNAISSPIHIASVSLIPVTSVQPQELCVEVTRIPCESERTEKHLLRSAIGFDSWKKSVSGSCRIAIQ